MTDDCKPTNETIAFPIRGTCPECGKDGHAKTIREPGQTGRTRCGYCLKATANRTWSDFKIVFNAVEQKAVMAQQLAQIGMAALTSEEVAGIADMSQIAAQGDPGATAQAYACIAAGHALNKYAHNRATRKAVNSVLSTVRETNSKPPTGKN